MAGLILYGEKQMEMDEYNAEIVRKAEDWTRKAKTLKSLAKGLDELKALATDEEARFYIGNLPEAWIVSGGNVGESLFK